MHQNYANFRQRKILNKILPFITIYMKNIFFFLMMFLSSAVFAQNSSISGKLISSEGEPINDILIELLPTTKTLLSNEKGEFNFQNLTEGNYTLQFNNNSSLQENVILGEYENVQLDDFEINESDIVNNLNTFTDLAVLEAGDESTSVSSLLTASRDVFMNKAGFQFGSDVFFRIRGYDSRYSDFMLNGIRYQNPETGWQPFSIVGGLNDVLRYRDVETIGSGSMENGFGEIGGARDYQLRPSYYGKGGRYTYSHLNRYYNHRVMATYSSGEQNGLSYLVSGSKRWAQEGYVDGTYYDAYGGYAAVEGEITDDYSVMVSALASPRRRGTNSIHRQEAYDLFGSNFYNADWGWQDGQKRNARLRKNVNPIFTFSNYINLGENTEAQLTGSYMNGHYIASRINRQFAANPDPDYYQNLPSFENQGEIAPFNFTQQLNWINFYRENQTETSDEVDEYAGVRANYILEDNYRADNEYQAIAHFNTTVNNNLTLDYGLNFRQYEGNFYQRINDLLGADYWLDVDTFFDNVPSNSENADDPRVYRDEKFGYDYNLNERNYDAFIQGRFSYDKVDFFLSGMVGKADFWREGNISSGKFPNTSKGKGEVKDFLIYGGKGGATYKLDNRNYFSASGMYYLKPPQLGTLWETPTTRDGFNDLTDVETVYGGELTYNHNSPKLKLRTTGYITRFEGQAESLLAYSGNDFRDGFGDDNLSTAFGNYFTNGIDKLHYGGEFGFDYNITPEFSFSGAAAVGKYTFMSRPIVTGYTDFTTDSNPTFPENSSFLLDFYEGNTPQTALNAGLTYRAPARFIINIDGNYYGNSYEGASALRRTLPVAETFVAPEPGMTQEEVLRYWTKQKRLPEAYRLNISLYKEFRFSYEKRLGINASMNNVLDDQGYPSLAFEDIRTENGMPFPTRYRYSPGRTYFINIAYKFM